MKRFACLAMALTLPLAWGQRDSAHWVATWASAQQQARGGGPPRGAAPQGARGPGGPAQAQAPAAQGPGQAQGGGPAAAGGRGAGGRGGGGFGGARAFNNQTVRMIVKSSIGGRRVRVHFSNAFGTMPLVIDSAHIALRDKDSSIAAGSDHTLTFNGLKGCTVPPGAEMISDAADLNVPKLADLAISVHVPSDTGPASVHSMGLHTAYIVDGDETGAAALTNPTTAQSWYWISAVDVDAAAKAGTIVAFGDSITDGATSTPDTDRSWPSVLAQRLQENPATANLGIVNEGISGNRVLGDGAGVSALARFDRDVLSQSGVKWLMIMESINDINGGARQGTITADALILGLKQMVEKAHTHGIKVAGCTLTPYGNISAEGEEMRLAVNKWIRTPGNFDAVVDFDAVIRDPQDPKQFKQGYNNTDKLHPNDTGYKAMADAVDLKMFTK